MTLSLAFALLGLVVTAIVAVCEHRRVIATRRALLDRCASALSEARISHSGDGFPRLEGLHDGCYLRAELVPDSMTIRRLPQLWLKLTKIEARPRFAEFSILVRPSGTEFYSLTSAHDVVLQPPTDIAAELIAKGSRPASQQALEEAAPFLRRAFSDPRTKEVAVTAKGLRLVWQAGEGARGDHLLLRQCRYENAGIDPKAFSGLLATLDDWSSSLDAAEEAEAA